jgi:hypothetical protein
MGVVSDDRCDPNIANLLEILDLAGHIRDQPLNAPGGVSSADHVGGPQTMIDIPAP